MNKSGIEWLCEADGTKGYTINPVIGCSRISPGCGGGYIKGPNGEQGGCWAEELVATRMANNPKLPMYHDLARATDKGTSQWTGVVKLVPERLKEIVALGKARKRNAEGKLVPYSSRVFVCDMSDLFHDAVPFEFIAAVFGAMACAPKHLFYVLTKRADRAVEWATQPDVREQVELMMQLGLHNRLEARFAPEQTKPISAWPGYFITSTGRVLTSLGSAKCLWCGADISGFAKRKYCNRQCLSRADYESRCGRFEIPEPTPVEMSPERGKYGHQRVWLYNGERAERMLVHRLVLEAFDRLPNDGEEACHIDGNPSNNALWNLRWGTSADNAEDRTRHGRSRTYHKLNEEDVAEIREAYASGASVADIMRMRFGDIVSDTQIHNIVRHAQWTQRARMPWPLPCVAFGVTVEDRRYGVPRLGLARKFPARYHWASVEPLLEDLGEVDFSGFDLVVAGGEAGKGSRPFDLQWARNVQDAARKAGSRYFMKQMGDNVVDNGIPIECGKKGNSLERIPHDLRIRENLPLPVIAT